MRPEEVLVIRLRGSVPDVGRSLRHIQGVEWLFDFDAGGEDVEGLSGNAEGGASISIFLTSTNQRAVDELYYLWKWYDRGQSADANFAPLWHVFKQIDEIRYWNAEDRLSQTDIRSYLREKLDEGNDFIPLEMQLWYRPSDIKRNWIEQHWERLISDRGGEIVSRSCISKIRYHALLARLPRGVVEEILDEPDSSFISADWTVQCLQDVGQSVGDEVVRDDMSDGAHEMHDAVSLKPPIAAIFDTLPAANHEQLAHFVRVEDPDDWASVVPVRDRVHGTSMASIVIHGDLNVATSSIDRAVVCMPVLKPVGGAGESFPDDRLMVDLIHERVLQLMSSVDGKSIRVINLSIGDSRTRLDRTISKLAKVIDYLAWRYQLLFVVSAGNHDCSFTVANPIEFSRMSEERLILESLKGAHATRASRRIISPGDSINALTVGATYHDGNTALLHPNLRILATPKEYPAPYSREGRGYRRSIKPDLTIEGGRIAFAQSVHLGHVRSAHLAPPGHRVAHPEGGYANTRGTSNAAAMITRQANIGASIIDELRATHGYDIKPKYDAVLLKGLLAHAARHGPVIKALVTQGVGIEEAEKMAVLTSGYGAFDEDSFARCTDRKATLFGVGSLFEDEAHDYEVPMPAELVGTTAHRRLILTLAYLSPVNASNKLYRSAKLGMRVRAADVTTIVGVGASAFDRNEAALGTLQHLVFEGNAAVAGSATGLRINVGCRSDAGLDSGLRVNYALLVTLEIEAQSDINIYQEMASALQLSPARVLSPATVVVAAP